MEKNHIILSRFSFEDKELMKIYLELTKAILIPSLRAQTNQNFSWGLIVKTEDIEFLRSELNFDFIPFTDFYIFHQYCVDNNINIQTRHDIDDWMADNYVEKIHELFDENIITHDNFLIQSQPIKLIYKTNAEVMMNKYTDNRNSMHLTLCQKIVSHHIYEKKHGQMNEVASHVITLPEGFTKWVIHEDNMSFRGK
jgi:hypothetical protein